MESRWKLRKVNTSAGHPAFPPVFALIDHNGKERMVGHPEDFGDLLGWDRIDGDPGADKELTITWGLRAKGEKV